MMGLPNWRAVPFGALALANAKNILFDIGLLTVSCSFNYDEYWPLANIVEVAHF